MNSAGSAFAKPEQQQGPSTGLTTTLPAHAPSAGGHSNDSTMVAPLVIVGGTKTAFDGSWSAYNTAVATQEAVFAKQKQLLTAELNAVRKHRELFLGKYTVLPWTERREGGQGVVQFMRSKRSDVAVAVKFFLSRTAYDAELELYRVDVLRGMMPEVQLTVANGDAAERSSRGYAWPPCIVLEMGESLQEWKARTRPAFSTILDVRLWRPCTDCSRIHFRAAV